MIEMWVNRAEKKKWIVGAGKSKIVQVGGKEAMDGELPDGNMWRR